MPQKFIDALNLVNPVIMASGDADLLGKGLIDSLDVMNLVTKLGEEFNVEFGVEDLAPENFSSAEAIWGLVRRLGGEA